VSYLLTKSIDVVGPVRAEPEGALEGLMASIKRFGMLHQITVIVNPDAPGRYIVLAGRRRLAAMQRLNRKKIRAKIREVDDIRAELLTITENYHRLDLTPAERDVQMIRYAELLRLSPPDDTPGFDRDTDKSGETVSLPSGYVSPQSKASDGALVNKVATEFGVSERTAQRVVRHGEMLSAEGRETLAKAGINDVRRLDRITAIQDPVQRAAVIESIGQGAGYSNAMAGVLGDAFTMDAQNMSDAEWLATLPCSGFAIDQQRFRSDALLYRKLQRAKIDFAMAVGWDRLKEKSEYRGLYFLRMALFMDCPHPRQWIKCSGCNAGQVDGKDHYACRGAGYLMK
jgi:ParB-like nuclease domain